MRQSIFLILLLTTFYLDNVLSQDSIRLSAIIRDTTPERNPDFEIANPNRVIPGLVKQTLGSDRKPVYCCGDSPAPTVDQYVIHNQTTFFSWFNTVPQVSLPLLMDVFLSNNRTVDPNVYYYVNNAFFPIDNLGWEAPGKDNTPNKHIYPYGHNYHFCLEIHARFTYLGKEVFNFEGDDDVWVFIDNQLVVDLGAPHDVADGKAFKSISLDTLPGMKVGSDHSFDFFYCERHSVESHIRLSTSIQLKCGYYDYCGVCEGDGSSCCDPKVTCNDNNACTDDYCPAPTLNIPLGQIPLYCRNIRRACNTTACGTYTCRASDGACIIDTPKVCPNPNNICGVPKCDEQTECTIVPVACDADSSCQTGVCVNATCKYTPVNCDDSNKCTTDVCISGAGCSHQQISCDDLNPCTNDACDPASGCTHTTIPDCVTCNSTAVCQTVDKCNPLECDPKNPGKCVPRPMVCNDNNDCTLDSCSAGKCIFAPKCVTTDPCLQQYCNGSTNGQCKVLPMDCNDGSPCTDDSCSAGKCVSVPAKCDDGNMCTNDKCNSTAGCFHEPLICPTKTCFDVTCDTKSGCVYTPSKCHSPNFCTVSVCDVIAGGCINYNRTCDSSNRDCYKASCNNVTNQCEEHAYDPLPFKCQSSAVKAGVAVGAAAIAGIVIGAAAAVGLAAFGGKKGYDLWKANQAAKMSVTATNPLYTPNPNQGTNPLYGSPST